MTYLRPRLAIAASSVLILCGSHRSFAQETPPQETSGTKQSAEARLKAVAKPKASGAAQDVIDTLSATHRFEQTAISPDGKKVAWVEDIITKHGVSTGDTVIYVADIGGKNPPKRISAAVADAIHAEGSVAWSPDSKKLAFLSDAAKAGQLQLYIMDVAGPSGSARKLTQVKGFLSTPGWSPSGKTIAVLFTENATRAAGPLVAETPETGEIKDSFFEQRLALVDVATAKLDQISPADTYIYEYDWSPDGLRFAVTAALGNGDNNWYIAELFTLDAATGLMKSIYKPPLQIANPAWSPDGQRIAFIGGLMSDEPSVGGDIFTIAATGGEATNITPDMKASASWLAWTPDGKIIFGEYLEGDSGLATINPADGPNRTLSRRGQTNRRRLGHQSLSFPRRQKLPPSFAARSAPRPKSGPAPPPTGRKSRNATNPSSPPGAKPKASTGKTTASKSRAGSSTRAISIPPKNIPWSSAFTAAPAPPSSPNGPAPPISIRPRWRRLFRSPAQSARQLRPGRSLHPRQRQRISATAISATSSPASTKPSTSRPSIPNRLGISGWSYGGFMTMWGVTQTNRFKAAMAGAGIANYLSYYGENKIDQWMIPFFGKSVYDDPEVYAKSSPITFIKNVKTPTLILVGDSDGEVPAPQSYEFWHALKTLGVETQFVVYEHEGHMFASPKHRRDVVERTLAWFDSHLK